MKDIKSIESSKKTQRPFYKKKRFLIPAGILVIGIIGSQMDQNKKASDISSTSSIKTEQGVSPNLPSSGIDLKTKLTNTIKSIDTGDDFTKNSMSSATDFQITAATFKAYASIVEEGKKSSDKEILKLTEDLEKKIIASQVKNFPKIRLAYYEFIKNKLWENDVYVDISGSNNTILKFTGAYFATNKNIKSTQETLQEILALLRFKQTQFKWYKEQDEYTYYTIEAPSDTKIEY